MVIINFKETKEVKEAIRVAAFHGGYKNSSQLLAHAVKSFPLISKELKKGKKKVS